MNGAERLMATAAGGGVEVCFANPGTTEIPLVAALDTVEGVRAVLCLAEVVVAGAADGYGRLTDRPAMTILHLGPGLGNAVSNLHNARRARTPVVNVVGDHASWHLAADAPLASDIDLLARNVSGWVGTSSSAEGLASDMAGAIAAALRGQVATLVACADHQWGEAGEGAVAVTPDDRPKASDAEVVEAAEMLTREGSVLLLGGRALRERGLRAAERVAAGTACAVMMETFPARVEQGADLPAPHRLGYFPELAANDLSDAASVVFAGALDPVAFFGYPEGRSRILDDGVARFTVASPEADVEDALDRLAERVGAPVDPGSGPERVRVPVPTGALDATSASAAIAALQPEGAIIVDESATSGVAWGGFAQGAPRHTWLTLTGGALGIGLPASVGAAIACPDRPVIAFQADGSAMYSLPALWTMAHEGLDVTVVVCSNRRYNIIGYELYRAGLVEPGAKARSMVELTPPELDFVSIASGMGVPAVRVTTADDLVAELRVALAEPGPHLIEMVL